ncbi:hypothetical protein [Microtetraspora malaysiensis]|uniref:hypothetical protein n=1 Tax=Microtetraspora malaysiensis TaxID=161358 RepID=UPI00082C219B|nr:hypothetical protein [Microtetraspora malaysiensis]
MIQRKADGLLRGAATAVLSLGLLAAAACGTGASYSQALIDRARAQGTAPDLIYAVEIPGFELAEQSVGVVGEDGFGAVYTSPPGRQVELRVNRGTFGDAVCAETPIFDAEPGSAVTCDHDEAGWYRSGGGRHEYVAVRGDHLIRLVGRPGEVARDALKSAVAGARNAVGDGTSTGDGSPPPSPVQRGDLPTHGDMAPDNHVGPGG